MLKYLVFILLINHYSIFCQSNLIFGLRPPYNQIYQGRPSTETVDIKVFYESLCPGCRHEFKYDLVPLVSKLSDSINLNIYPYGKATTFIRNGKYEFESQHGPLETYGNKLHSCAVNMLQNSTAAVLYNSCMMDDGWAQGSDDIAADVCARNLGIDSMTIKKCAKSELGSRLLKLNGDVTATAFLKHVPSVFINGRFLKNNDNLFKEVCGAFINPPPACWS